MKYLAVILAAFAFTPALGKTTAAEEKRFKVCQGKLQQAKKLGVLQDLRIERGFDVRVMVGTTYHKIPFDSKEGFADTVHCFLMSGSEGQCIDFDIRDGRSGVVVGKYKNCRLKVD